MFIHSRGPNLHKPTLFLVCICLLFSLVACSDSDNSSSALAGKAQIAADRLVSDYGPTSVQYAIIDKGSIILSGSSGVFDKTGNRAVTRDDMFGIGSTSKMFVTAAAMSLVDKGMLDIDAPLTDYIPEFRMADARYTEITPRMLMNHSAGFYGSSFTNSFLFDDPDQTAHDTLLDRLATQTLRTAPGEMSEYCNDGFSVLEILVERISGLGYTEYLADNFSKPLGLKNTKTPQDDFDRTQLAKVYLPLYDGALPTDTLNVIGTGGVYSTAEDLCSFAQVLMGKKPEILSSQSASLMQNEEYKRGLWPDDGGESLVGYGLGWDTVHAFPFGDYGMKVAVKGGDSQMFHSSLVTIPAHDIAMAVVSSGGASAPNYAFAANVLQELLLEKGLIKQISPLRSFEAPVQVPMPSELEAYTGTYANANYQQDIVVKDGLLTVTSPQGENQYVYAGDNVFKSADGSESKKFVQLGNGNTYLQSNSYPILPGLGQLAACAFDCQKLNPEAIAESLLTAWSKRAGKKYYAVSEKPTSQVYFMDSNMLRIILNHDFSNGYAYAGAKIVDENFAVNTVTFRDVADLKFDTRDGVEYLTAGGMVSVSEDSMPDMSLGTWESVIGPDGCAKYYCLTSEAAGKTMTVNMPSGAAYAVYDKNDVCLDFSTVSHNNTTVLPTEGKVAFIGKAGSVFEVELK